MTSTNKQTKLKSSNQTEWEIKTGTTILEGIQRAVSSATQVVYEESPADAAWVAAGGFEHAIVVVGEPTYTEMMGDSSNLTIPQEGLDTIEKVCSATECVVVLISGRPLVIEPHLASMSALVAAWLPGSQGEGIADVLFGDFDFHGKSPRTWFKSVDQLPMNWGDSSYDPLFPYAFGLTTGVGN